MAVVVGISHSSIAQELVEELFTPPLSWQRVGDEEGARIDDLIGEVDAILVEPGHPLFMTSELDQAVLHNIYMIYYDRDATTLQLEGPAGIESFALSDLKRPLERQKFRDILVATVRAQHRAMNTSDFADRLELIADSLAELRVNSAQPHLDELREVVSELRYRENLATDAESRSIVRSASEEVLPILQKLVDALSNTQLGRLAVSGAVTAVLTAGGWPTVAVFALSNAVMHGPAMFEKAMRLYSPPPRNRDD